MQKIAKIITLIIDFLYRPFARLIPQQMFRYAACGGGNLLLDWVLYFLFYNFVVGHDLVYLQLPVSFNFQLSTFNFYKLCLTPHIAAFCMVFPVTLLTGFWLNKYVTFTRSSLRGVSQLGRYILVVAVNLAINYFGLKLFVESFGWYPTPSKILVTLFTVAISFLSQKYFSFRQ